MSERVQLQTAWAFPVYRLLDGVLSEVIDLAYVLKTASVVYWSEFLATDSIPGTRFSEK
jgi:hypothetical protein